jgi:NADPH:quinone reductase-like Zn-dependent oxidoreductase
MIAPSAAAMQELTDGYRRGRLRCHVDGEFGLGDVPRAIAASRAGHVQGKLVVRVA